MALELGLCMVHIFLILFTWSQDSLILRTQQQGFLAPLSVLDLSQWQGCARALKATLCGLGWVLIRISFNHKGHKLQCDIGLSRMDFSLVSGLALQLSMPLYRFWVSEGSAWPSGKQHLYFRCRTEERMQKDTPTSSLFKDIGRLPQTYAYVLLAKT